MSNYTTNTKLNITFEGDNVRIVLKRLKRKDMLSLMEFMDRQDDGSMITTDDKLVDMMNTVGGWIDDYIVSFEGLEDSGGNALTFESVKSDQYFSELFQRITNHLMSVDSLGRDEEKKSVEPLEDTAVPLLLADQAG